MSKVLVTVSAVMLHLAIGSVYAWSVLVNPITEATDFPLLYTASVFSLTIFCLGMTAAFFGNKVHGIRTYKLCIATLVLFLGGMLLSSFAVSIDNYPLLLLGYGVFVGIGTGIGYLVPIPILMTWYDHYKAVATGLVITGFGLSSLLTAHIYHQLITVVTIDNTLAYAGALLSILILPSIFFLRKKKGSDIRDAQYDAIAFKDIIQNKDFYLTWLLFFCNISIGVSVIAFLAPMTQELYTIPVFEAVTLVGIAGIINGLSRLAWSSLSEFTGRPIAIAALIAFEFFAVMSILYFDNYSVFKLCILVVIACYGGLFALMPTYVADIFDVSKVKQIFGSMLSAWGLAGMSSPMIATAIYAATGSYKDIFFGMTVLCCINLFLVILLTQRNITK